MFLLLSAGYCRGFHLNVRCIEFWGMTRFWLESNSSMFIHILIHISRSESAKVSSIIGLSYIAITCSHMPSKNQPIITYAGPSKDRLTVCRGSFIFPFPIEHIRTRRSSTNYSLHPIGIEDQGDSRSI